MPHSANGLRFAFCKLAIGLVEPERIEEAAPGHRRLSFAAVKRTLEPFSVQIEDPTLGA
jgi:hypothetical protein